MPAYGKPPATAIPLSHLAPAFAPENTLAEQIVYINTALSKAKTTKSQIQEALKKKNSALAHSHLASMNTIVNGANSKYVQAQSRTNRIVEQTERDLEKALSAVQLTMMISDKTREAIDETRDYLEYQNIMGDMEDQEDAYDEDMEEEDAAY